MSKSLDEAGKLKSEIEAFQESINQHALTLKEKQDAKKQLTDDLNKIRCKAILRDIDKIVKDYLKIQQPFETLKAKVIEIQTSDSSWVLLPKELGEPGLYIEVCDALFRGDRINSLTLAELIAKVKTFDAHGKEPIFNFKD